MMQCLEKSEQSLFFFSQREKLDRPSGNLTHADPQAPSDIGSA
jgi:hypothetical protein